MNEKEAASKDVVIATRESEKIADEVTKVRIRSDADLNLATEKLAQIKKVYKDIDKRRKSFVDPLNRVVKDINTEFKIPLDRLKAAETLIKDAMVKYQAQVDARAAKKAEKIEAAIDAGEMDVAEGMAKLSTVKQAPTGSNAQSGSASFKVVKKIKIVDVSLIPTSYFLRERVMEAVRMEVEADVKGKGLPMPAGAEFVEERQVAVRTA
mgnify:CR=1 FL=1